MLGGLLNSYEIALVGDQVVVAELYDGGQFSALPKIGGAATAVATPPGTYDFVARFDAGASETYFYSIETVPGTVSRTALSDGATITLSTGEASPWTLASDGARLYWPNRGSGEVRVLDMP